MKALRETARRLAGRAERCRGRDDAGAALLLVIMVMLVVAMLGAMITAAVVQQVQPTRFASKNSSTVYAAETGLQAALSQVRTAAAPPNNSNVVYGSPAQLPCGPLTGAVGSDATLTYSVAIAYYADDPTAPAAAVAPLVCTPGSGLAVSPKYALLTAQGLARGVPGLATAAGNRTLSSLYSFSLTNANVSGGLLWATGKSFCVQADSSAAGSHLTYVDASQCVRSAPLQTWQWDTDYRIRLTATVSSPGSGECITGVFSGSSPATLAPCDASRNDQLFSYQGGGYLRGQNSGNTDYGSTCLSDGSSSSPWSGAMLTSSDGGCQSGGGSFSPDPKFGAGAAGASTRQLVNYAQFGRCFDVTGEDIHASNMILYPCKQDPSNTGKLYWNHKFFWTEPTSGASVPQTLIVYPGNDTNNPYCLTTPAAGASPAYPTFTPCTAGASTQQWVRTTAVTGNYAASYTMTDASGRCLGVGPLWSGDISSVNVATCTGGPEQKWDAPPNPVDASLTNTREVARGN